MTVLRSGVPWSYLVPATVNRTHGILIRNQIYEFLGLVAVKLTLSSRLWIIMMKNFLKQKTPFFGAGSTTPHIRQRILIGILPCIFAVQMLNVIFPPSKPCKSPRYVGETRNKSTYPNSQGEVLRTWILRQSARQEKQHRSALWADEATFFYHVTADRLVTRKMVVV